MINLLSFVKDNVLVINRYFIFLILPLRKSPPCIFALGGQPLLQHFLRAEVDTIRWAVSSVQFCLLCDAGWITPFMDDTCGVIRFVDLSSQPLLTNACFPNWFSSHPVILWATLHFFHYYLSLFNPRRVGFEGCVNSYSCHNKLLHTG